MNYFSTEMHSQESIQLLQDSGIDFERLQRDGIDIEDFGELLTTSGLICNENVTWLSFHRFGSSLGILLFSKINCLIVRINQFSRMN